MADQEARAALIRAKLDDLELAVAGTAIQRAAVAGTAVRSRPAG